MEEPVEATVYLVLLPIPEADALPGDYIRFAPSEPGYQLVLCRHLDEDSISPEDPRLRACASVTASEVATSPRPRLRHPHLRVVG